MALLGTTVLLPDVGISKVKVTPDPATSINNYDLEIFWYDGIVPVVRTITVPVSDTAEPGAISDTLVAEVNEAWELAHPE